MKITSSVIIDAISRAYQWERMYRERKNGTGDYAKKLYELRYDWCNSGKPYPPACDPVAYVFLVPGAEEIHFFEVKQEAIDFYKGFGKDDGTDATICGYCGNEIIGAHYLRAGCVCCNDCYSTFHKCAGCGKFTAHCELYDVGGKQYCGDCILEGCSWEDTDDKEGVEIEFSTKNEHEVGAVRGPDYGKSFTRPEGKVLVDLICSTDNVHKINIPAMNYAKENNLIVVYAYNLSGNVEIFGAIEDVFVNVASPSGKFVQGRCKIAHSEEGSYALYHVPASGDGDSIIHALVIGNCDDFMSYNIELPYKSFGLFLDGGIYCAGIVLDRADVVGREDTISKEEIKSSIKPEAKTLVEIMTRTRNVSTLNTLAMNYAEENNLLVLFTFGLSMYPIISGATKGVSISGISVGKYSFVQCVPDNIGPSFTVEGSIGNMTIDIDLPHEAFTLCVAGRVYCSGIVLDRADVIS